MNDPVFLWSYAIFFGGTFAMVGALMYLDRRSKPGKDHPAAGE